MADTDMNIRFVETKTKTYTAIPTISQGTLLKLIERVTYHKYTGSVHISNILIILYCNYIIGISYY